MEGHPKRKTKGQLGPHGSRRGPNLTTPYRTPRETEKGRTMFPLRSPRPHVQRMPQENEQAPSLHQSPDSHHPTDKRYHYRRSNHLPNGNGRREGQPLGGGAKGTERQRSRQSLKRSVHRTGGFLNCSTSTTWGRAKGPNCLYHNIQKINIPFTVCVERSTVEKALLDSGAMDNFIDHRTTERLGIQMETLTQPIRLTNVDGTTNQAGRIESYCEMTIQSGHQRHITRFYETSLGEDRIIFGYPWLRTFNPQVDWEKGKVSMPWPKAWVKRRETSIALTEQVPEEYRRHSKVFDEREADRFPPKREEDHAINLKEDAPAILDCKIYPLSHDQDAELTKFLGEHLRKGYIRESKSPYVAPFFFIKKKDGKLRPVQDYRKLNEQTVRDNYPLPLIKTILEQLQGRSLFTKFDIRWGYNNIRIKEGDEWKAAFKTPTGLFEPRVMFFGLTNSPATFQRTMNRMFREMRMRYPNELFVYMDDILIATDDDLA